MFQKSNWHFGAGQLLFRAQGATPIRVATLQGIDVDISASTKELMGSRQFAEATQRTGIKISGKVQMGRWDGRIVSELLLGAKEADVSAGTVVVVDNEPGTVPVGGGEITVTKGATFDMDMGVRDVATAGFYRRVSAAPAAGEYAVDDATGDYTFAAADAGKKVQISYAYIDLAKGSTTTISNQEMGESPTFELVTYDSGLFMQLYACTFSKLSLSRKNEDFVIPNMEWSAAADDVRGVGRLSGA